MSVSNGFLLGLSTGAICVAYCGPVMIPYLLGEGKSIGKNLLLVFLFLAGRLIAYVMIGILAGLIGKTILQPSETRDTIMGVIYLLLALLLVAYGFYRFGEICLGKAHASKKLPDSNRFPLLIPITGGLITGLNICPPFLLAITAAIDSGTIANSILFFLMFFLGTAIYFIPFPLVGFFRRQHVLRIIGKFAAVLTGLLYFYMGLILILK